MTDAQRTELPPAAEGLFLERSGRVEDAARLPDLTQEPATDHVRDAPAARARHFVHLHEKRDGSVLVPDVQLRVGRVPLAEAVPP